MVALDGNAKAAYNDYMRLHNCAEIMRAAGDDLARAIKAYTDSNNALNCVAVIRAITEWQRASEAFLEEMKR